MDTVELLPNLHMLRFDPGQAYLWQDTEELTLIDTGIPGSADAIAEVIRSLGRDPGELRRIVLTHFHGDHTGSAAELRERYGARVLAHSVEAPIVAGEQEPPQPNLLDWERPLFEQVGDHLTGPPVPVDQELSDGDVLDFGGGAHVRWIPGHTEGSIAVHLAHHGVLFTGDTIARTEDQVILGVFNVHRARTIESFRLLSGLDTAIACFGHGAPLTENAGARLREAAAGLGA